MILITKWYIKQHNNNNKSGYIFTWQFIILIISTDHYHHYKDCTTANNAGWSWKKTSKESGNVAVKSKQTSALKIVMRYT